MEAVWCASPLQWGPYTHRACEIKNLLSFCYVQFFTLSPNYTLVSATPLTVAPFTQFFIVFCQLFDGFRFN